MTLMTSKNEFKDFSDAYDSMLHKGEAQISFNYNSDSIEILVNGEKVGYLNYDIEYTEDVIDAFKEMNLGFNPHKLTRFITYGEKLAYVEMLYIRKEWRRRGLAGILLKEYVEKMHEKGIFQIVLRAEPDEGSISTDKLSRFYRRFGFRELERTPDGGVLMVKI